MALHGKTKQAKKQTNPEPKARKAQGARDRAADRKQVQERRRRIKR